MCGIAYAKGRFFRFKMGQAHAFEASFAEEYSMRVCLQNLAYASEASFAGD
ncbi:hypothetical protein J2Z22_002431 [Paenibacillus forsythiae]|uniref:Uncharacterized protein n=1 Tax=Paenibacillus forsythiae TaxID=365616 RepID=A0ABU3H7U5_9BACL|nr:hypothetical protein [Paenibacillus forsythiae]MDT3426897.1 hypothetical protein [Paenibacillus forsythiae]